MKKKNKVKKPALCCTYNGCRGNFNRYFELRFNSKSLYTKNDCKLQITQKESTFFDNVTTENG